MIYIPLYICKLPQFAKRLLKTKWHGPLHTDAPSEFIRHEPDAGVPERSGHQIEACGAHYPMSQTKLANLGAVVRGIEAATPRLLQETMPRHLVHPHICFAVFPETYSLHVNGQAAYTTLQKMIQLGVSPWLIPSGSQLTILSSRLSEARELTDRRLQVHWRSVLPEQTGPAPSGLSLQPGSLIRSLALLPHEYPVLAGSFEFGFDSECERIILHVLRNVEYMAKPDSEPICT